MRIKLTKRRTSQEHTRRTTKVQLSGEDLAALTRFVAAGQVLLQADYPPVVARLKAAMTRLGVPAPKGL
jgi:hypothetical protein